MLLPCWAPPCLLPVALGASLQGECYPIAQARRLRHRDVKVLPKLPASGDRGRTQTRKSGLSPCFSAAMYLLHYGKQKSFLF